MNRKNNQMDAFEFLDTREPLQSHERLSDDLPRLELDCLRSNLMERRRANTACWGGRGTFYGYLNFHGGEVRDLEIILKPNLDTEFWPSLLKTSYMILSQTCEFHISMMSNLVCCALIGQESYQDPDGTCHIPLFCNNLARYQGKITYLSRNIPGRKCSRRIRFFR